jgi:hypothetical protein
MADLGHRYIESSGAKRVMQNWMRTWVLRTECVLVVWLTDEFIENPNPRILLDSTSAGSWIASKSVTTKPEFTPSHVAHHPFNELEATWRVRIYPVLEGHHWLLLVQLRPPFCFLFLIMWVGISDYWNFFSQTDEVFINRNKTRLV